MNEIIEQVVVAIRGTWRYRWYTLLTAWVICVTGWVLIYRLPDVYQSQARVEVDTKSMLQPLLSGIAFDLGTGTELSLLIKTLLTRPNLERIASESGLYTPDPDSSPPGFLIKDLRKGIGIAGGFGDGIYTIKFRHGDPQVARNVVESTMRIFLEEAQGAMQSDTQMAEDFLDQQILDYERRLEEADQRLVEFKRENMGRMPNQGQGYYQYMQQVESQLEQARLTLLQAENRKLSLERQLSGEESVLGENTAVAQVAQTLSQPIDVRIQNMEQLLDGMLLRYTEEHPDVIATREAIEGLRVQRSSALANWTASLSSVSPGAGARNVNPIYQQIKMALSQEEANIASLQVEVSEYEKRLEEQRQLVNTVPQVEAQFAALNRDYAVTQGQYQQLLDRRGRVKLGSRADSEGTEIDFKILEAAYVPAKPEGPPRLLLYSGILVVGIGVGVVLAFLLFQVWPTFDSVKTLISNTSVPVLGTVELVLAGKTRFRRRVKGFAYFTLSGTLFAAYAGLFAYELARLEILPTLSAV